MAVSYLGTYNIDIYRGDDLIKNFTLNNVDEPGFDYTGTTILFQIKGSTEDSVAAVEDTPTPTTSTLGEIVVPINIPGSVTATLSPGEYVYDIQYTLPSGVVRTYVGGKVTVQADVSRT